MVAGAPVTRLLPQETKRFSREYELCALIGKGSFGEVWVCRERRTGERVAVKLIDKAGLRTYNQREDVRREVAILQAFRGRHDGVVQLREVLEGESLVQVAMELCEGGDLFEMLREKGALPEEGAKFLFRQLASALAFCHANGIIHRDIKPENVLLDSPLAAELYNLHSAADKAPRVKAKLADFGLSVVLGPEGVVSGYTGSRYYTAPEMVRGWKYGRGADVWSMGVVLCAMLTGRLPFSGSDKHDLAGLRQAILKGKVNFAHHSWAGVSETARGLVRRMLTVDPRARITAEELLSHPWLAEGKGAANVVRREPQGLATLSLPSSPLDPHRNLRCQRPFGSAGLEMMSEFKLCKEREEAGGKAGKEEEEEEQREKGKEKERAPAQAPAELAMGVPVPGQVESDNCRMGEAGEGRRAVVVNEASSHHPVSMCCVGPAALADFSAPGVWCFPTLMATAWLDGGEEDRQEGGCEEQRNKGPSGKYRGDEAPEPTSPSRSLNKAKAGFPFRLGEPHMCIAPREEFYVR